MTEIVDSKRRLSLTAGIVAAYLQKNKVPQAGLPALITTVHAALGGEAPPPIQAAKPPPPAAPVISSLPKRTVFPDYILCLEDGRKLKTLKRHLRAAFDLSPEQYREKWGLPQDYPMVAPSYAQKRSVLARNLGLGRKSEEEEPEIEMVAAQPPPSRPTPEPMAVPAAIEIAVQALEAFTPEPVRAREPSADSVFANFPKPESDSAPEPSPDSIGGGPRRVPFSKQRARPMRK